MHGDNGNAKKHFNEMVKGYGVSFVGAGVMLAGANAPDSAVIKAGATTLLSTPTGQDAAKQASTKALQSVRLGQYGEQFVSNATGLTKNTQKFIVNGSTRIPDFVEYNAEGAMTRIIESKNVGYLSYTSQIKDYVDLAQKNNIVLDIYTRFDAGISSNLAGAEASGLINIFREIK